MSAQAWGRLSAAITHYTSLGYEYVDAPWAVTDEYSKMTCPQQHKAYPFSPGGCLVGSAEQSLLSLDGTGLLPKGKFVAITPCFRNDTIDDTHQKWFMKVELYRNDDHSDEALLTTVNDAFLFFERLGVSPELEKTADGFDINLNGVEIGSYGLRKNDRLSWVYGTGLAEPRFGYASSMNPHQTSRSGRGALMR